MDQRPLAGHVPFGPVKHVTPALSERFFRVSCAPVTIFKETILGVRDFVDMVVGLSRFPVDLFTTIPSYSSLAASCVLVSTCLEISRNV